VVNFDVCKKIPQNLLVTIVTTLELAYCKSYVSFIIHIPTSINAKNMVKIGLVIAEIFGGICQFLPSHPKKGAFVTLVIFGITGPIFVRLHRMFPKILLLNICESEWRYLNQFWNAVVLN